MSFRRDGKAQHEDRSSWDAWVEENRQLFDESGLPPGTYRSHGDWKYLLLYGYWCDNDYGEHVRNLNFDSTI